MLIAQQMGKSLYQLIGIQSSISTSKILILIYSRLTKLPVVPGKEMTQILMMTFDCLY
jgi:hypothetical protein